MQSILPGFISSDFYAKRCTVLYNFVVPAMMIVQTPFTKLGLGELWRIWEWPASTRRLAVEAVALSNLVYWAMETAEDPFIHVNQENR